MARIYIEKVNAYIDDETNDIKDMATNETINPKEYEKRMRDWVDANREQIVENKEQHD